MASTALARPLAAEVEDGCWWWWWCKDGGDVGSSRTRFRLLLDTQLSASAISSGFILSKLF